MKWARETEHFFGGYFERYYKMNSNSIMLIEDKMITLDRKRESLFFERQIDPCSYSKE